MSLMCLTVLMIVCISIREGKMSCISSFCADLA